jgi:ABC-type branched-subunit amino acid transport system ATPase component
MSGGEQQMLAVGMALVARPQLLLLDEPLLGLSPMMQHLLVDAIKGLKAKIGHYGGHQRAVCAARASHDRFWLHH